MKNFLSKESNWEDRRLNGVVFGSNENPNKISPLTKKKRALDLKIRQCSSNKERKKLIEQEVDLNLKCDKE